jgi:AcrR family transcriptional regulator
MLLPKSMSSTPSTSDAAPAAERPIRADARRNRQRVLEAARACFSEDGLEAQIDEIASRAGVGVGTVYRHFSTKDALLRALVGDFFVAEAALAERALTREEPWDAFSYFMRESAELLGANRAVAQIMAGQPELGAEGAAGADAELGFFTSLERLIARGRDAGVLRPDFAFEDIPAIMCALGSLQISYGAYKNWRRVLEIVLDGSRAPGSGSLDAASAQ